MKSLQVWKPLVVGQRVKVSRRCSARQYRGQQGTIIEAMPFERMDGWMNYGVRLDPSPNQTTDLRRFELSKT